MQQLKNLDAAGRAHKSAISQLQDQMQHAVARANEAAAQDASRRLTICKRAVRRMLLLQLAQSWQAFADAVLKSKKYRLTMQRVLGRMKHRDLSAALDSLREHVALQVRVKKVCMQAVSHMRKVVSSRCWHTWCKHAAAAARLRRLIDRSSSMRRRGTTYTALQQWCNVVEDSRRVAEQQAQMSEAERANEKVTQELQDQMQHAVARAIEAAARVGRRHALLAEALLVVVSRQMQVCRCCLWCNSTLVSFCAAAAYDASRPCKYVNPCCDTSKQVADASRLEWQAEEASQVQDNAIALARELAASIGANSMCGASQRRAGYPLGKCLVQLPLGGGPSAVC